MFTEMMMSASGGGNGYNIDPTQLTDLECVSAWNPGSTTTQQYIKFTNIPYTDNVLYLIMAKNYSEGNWEIGNKYGYTHNINSGLILIDSEIITTIGYLNYSLSGTTLTSDIAGRYIHYGLFVLDNK